MKTIVAYKVTTRANRSVTCLRSEDSITYKTEDFVSPICGAGALCCFRTAETALLFSEPNCGDRIWECLAVPSKSKAIHHSKDGYPTQLTVLPLGTILADKVKLVKRLNIRKLIREMNARKRK